MRSLQSDVALTDFIVKPPVGAGLYGQKGHYGQSHLPPHTSWLNQVEIWFGTLSRLVLKRGDHASATALRHQVLAFIAHYNRALAKPIKWTYTGRVTPTEQAAAPAPPVQAQAA